MHKAIKTKHTALNIKIKKYWAAASTQLFNKIKHTSFGKNTAGALITDCWACWAARLDVNEELTSTAGCVKDWTVDCTVFGL